MLIESLYKIEERDMTLIRSIRTVISCEMELRFEIVKLQNHVIFFSVSLLFLLRLEIRLKRSS